MYVNYWFWILTESNVFYTYQLQGAWETSLVKALALARFKDLKIIFLFETWLNAYEIEAIQIKLRFMNFLTIETNGKS